MKETARFGSSLVHLTLMTPSEFSKLNNPCVTSVHGFVVQDNKTLFTVNLRGLDIIGGHLEQESCEECLIREAKEEACIVVESYELIGAIEVDNSDNEAALKKGYPLKGYQLFYNIKKWVELPFQVTHECTSRTWVPITEVPRLHHNWLKVHQELLSTAVATS